MLAALLVDICEVNDSFIKVDVPQNIQNKLSKNIAHFTRDDTLLVYEQAQHAAEALTPYVENVIEHVPANISTTLEPVAQKLKPLGRGSTGRMTPKDLHEQLVMEEAVANHVYGKPIPINKGMTDIRWHQDDGWEKMFWRSHGIEVHYVMQKKNGIITAIDDFKFKDYQGNL